MLKLLTIASLVILNSNINFVEINSIECVSNIGEKIGHFNQLFPI